MYVMNFFFKKRSQAENHGMDVRGGMSSPARRISYARAVSGVDGAILRISFVCALISVSVFRFMHISFMNCFLPYELAMISVQSNLSYCMMPV